MGVLGFPGWQHMGISAEPCGMSASTKSVHADDAGLMNTGAIDPRYALTAPTVAGEVVQASLPCFQPPQLSCSSRVLFVKLSERWLALPKLS